MAHYATTVSTTWSADDAFTFMADLRNFADWDPGVKSSTQVRGDGPEPGAQFDVEVNGVGGGTTLRYELVEFDAPNRVVARAESAMFTSVDEIVITDTGDGSVDVTYAAELTLNGILGLADPVLKIAFKRIGDKAAAGLRGALKQPAPNTSSS